VSDDGDWSQHPATAGGSPTAAARAVRIDPVVAIVSASPAPARQVAGGRRRGI